MKNKISRRSFLAAAAVSAAALAVSGCDAKKSKKEVTDITVWNHYNGDQLESFNRLVSTFNETIGKEKGIRVTGSSQGTVNDLEANVMDAAEGKVGSAEMPTIFAAYADTAYKLDQMGMVVDLKDYLTEDEQAAFVPGYITEGDFDGSGSIKIFPVAKSTELMFFNDTDWQRFAKETFVRYGALSTMEGVTAVAEQYYNWSGGRALFGRDAMVNYMIVGAKQLGCEIFEVHNGKMTLHFDHDVVRKLWDNYYVPYIKGWCSASGKFRSDDIKIGSLLAYVGSSSSASFFPTQVLTSDTESHGIEMAALPCPSFADCEPVAVQQGAGMVVIPGTEDEISACVAFLKWFTQPENNLQFSVQSGYMPVTYAANSISALENSGLTVSDRIHKVLSLSIDAIDRSKLYTTHAFPAALRARNTLQYALEDRVTADRATVLERLAAGQTPEEAEAEFLADAFFDAWYDQTLAALSAFAG